MTSEDASAGLDAEANAVNVAAAAEIRFRKSLRSIACNIYSGSVGVKSDAGFHSPHHDAGSTTGNRHGSSGKLGGLGGGIRRHSSPLWNRQLLHVSATAPKPIAFVFQFVATVPPA